jgi:ADP-ribose pyrophosphatase
MNSDEGGTARTAHLREEKLANERVFSGVLLQVNRDRIQLPDGKESIREWIDHPGAAAAVPYFEDGSTILVRQYRYAVGRVFLEIPAGKCDKAGEPPEAVAHRELEEETGWRAGRLEGLGAAYPGIGYSNECIHLYLARDLTQGERSLDTGEFLDLVRMPLLQCVEWAFNGKLEDMKSALAIQLAARKLGIL